MYSAPPTANGSWTQVGRLNIVTYGYEPPVTNASKVNEQSTKNVPLQHFKSHRLITSTSQSDLYPSTSSKLYKIPLPMYITEIGGEEALRTNKETTAAKDSGDSRG
jgi:hypothetical protein